MTDARPAEESDGKIAAADLNLPTDLRSRAGDLASTKDRNDLLLAADLVQKHQAGEIDLAGWPSALNFVRSWTEFEA